MLITMVKVGGAGFLSSRLFRSLGKAELAEIMSFCGWIGIGIAFFTGLGDLEAAISNSEVVATINSAKEFIAWVKTFTL
jgi:hypothetical protein